MNYSFEEVLRSMSLALDLSELSIYKTNAVFDSISDIHYNKETFLDHTKKTTYIALELCRELKLDESVIESIYLTSLIHDIGAIESLTESHTNSQFLLEHCVSGAEMLSSSLFHDISNLIMYHHENWNGSGPHGLSGNNIPFGSQVIHLGDIISIKFANVNIETFNRYEVISWVSSNRDKLFSSTLVDAFINISKKDAFWLNIFNTPKLPSIISSIAPKVTKRLSLDELEIIAYIFSRIVDRKNPFTARHSREISDLAHGVAEYIGFTKEKCQMMKIAGLFHDIGKLAIPSSILNKAGSLTPMEFNIIKSHAYYTNTILSEISNFDDIRQWASNHHEKLNGTGYPQNLEGSDLSLECRIMAVCDIYQALTEDRPYRDGMSQEQAVDILNDMVEKNQICKKALNLLLGSLS